jgi:hypothetical protein
MLADKKTNIYYFQSKNDVMMDTKFFTKIQKYSDIYNKTLFINGGKHILSTENIYSDILFKNIKNKINN